MDEQVLDLTKMDKFIKWVSFNKPLITQGLRDGVSCKLYMYLLACVGEQGEGIKTTELGELLGLSQKTVIKGLKQLEEKGALKIEATRNNGKQGVNRYTVYYFDNEHGCFTDKILGVI